MFIETPNNVGSTLKLSAFTKDYSANQRAYTLNCNFPIRESFSLTNATTTNSINEVNDITEENE